MFHRKMKYIIQFSHSYFQFRIPELNSLLELNGLRHEDCYDLFVFFIKTITSRTTYTEDNPYLIINLPGDDVAKSVFL